MEVPLPLRASGSIPQFCCAGGPFSSLILSLNIYIPLNFPGRKSITEEFLSGIARRSRGFVRAVIRAHCERVRRLKGDCRKWNSAAEEILKNQEDDFYRYKESNYLNEINECAKILGIDSSTVWKVLCSTDY